MRTLHRAVEYDPKYPVRLVVFSDTHIGHPEFYAKGFKKFLAEEMEPPNSWLLGLGDHLECVVPVDKRFQLSAIALAEDRDEMDSVVDLQIAEFCALVGPYKDRILGLAMGNHELTIVKKFGTNPHRRMCEWLGCEDLGMSFMLRWGLRLPHGRTRSVVVYGHHGWGGGSRTEGGNVTKYARAVESFVADIYLFGHSHDQWIKKKPRVTVDANGAIQHRDAILANTGTWKKTLSNRRIPSWEESKGFPPRLLGGVVIEIVPLRSGWVDLRAA